MFTDSKYTKWYYSIVMRAQKRELSGYRERHHVVPRSFGGSDEKWNLVDLTTREHFVCHLLLVKMTSGKEKYKMMCAIMRMSKEGSIKSRTYRWVKEEFAKATSALHKGKKLSEQHKANIGEAVRGTKQTNEWIKKRTVDVWSGKKHSAESIEKMSQSHKGIRRVGWNHTDETKQKLSDWHARNKPSLGLKRAESTKQLLSQKNMGTNNPNHGKKWWNDGNSSKLSVGCPGEKWTLGRLSKMSRK
jgi:hypothetical protein